MSILDRHHIDAALNKARTSSGYDSIRILMDELFDESVWMWEYFDDFLQDYLSNPNAADYDMVTGWYVLSVMQSSTGDCNDVGGSYVT